MPDHTITHLRFATIVPVLAAATLLNGSPHALGQTTAACPADNGGITLSPGFCATIFADNLGHVRHMVVAPNGVLYVNSWSGGYYQDSKPPTGSFLIALKDTKSSGHADIIMRFGKDAAEGSAGGTGIAYYNDAIYAEVNDKILRYHVALGEIAPKANPQVVVSGLPLGGDHPMHPFAIDPDGNLFVDLGSATNSCQAKNRMPNSPGLKPCIELETRGGTWRYDANKTDQKFSPAERYATGIRNGEGFAFDSAGHLYVTQHGRDQLTENWPDLYKIPQQGADLPAEEVVQLKKDGDYGWPECYFDGFQKKLVLAPEFGGDGGKAVGICAEKQAPVAFFPAHWAPNALLIENDPQFPAPYRGGAFVAFHGSWNRAPLPQGGYNVVFQPMADGKASGDFIVFADGFAGAIKQPDKATFRPTGLAAGKDGALYISDDIRGRIWRVTYAGGTAPTAIAPAPAPVIAAVPSSSAAPPEGTHPDAGLPTPPGASPDQVALGDRIFHGQVDGGSCSGCHGTDAEGTSNGSSLISGHWLWGDGSLAAITHTIANGVPQPKHATGAMPPKGGAQLSQTDVAAVAAYVWAIGHRH
jgi:glucose/arabinose dehydrogenase